MSEQFDQVDSGAPANVVVPDLDPTGVDAIDQAVAELSAVASLDVDEHAGRYESAHEVLRQTLARAGDA